MFKGIRASGKGVLVQAPPSHRGLYIWHAMTWRQPEAVPLIPVPEFGPELQGTYVTFTSFVLTKQVHIITKLLYAG
jgi:hypothetical protein